MMSHVGQPIRFRVPEEHHTETVKGEDKDGKPITVNGSVHHAERREFAGIVTHSVAEGKRELHDIVIFPPGRPPLYLEGVSEGDGPGTLSLVAGGAASK